MTETMKTPSLQRQLCALRLRKAQIILLMRVHGFLTIGCEWFPRRLVRPNYSHSRVCYLITV